LLLTQADIEEEAAHVAFRQKRVYMENIPDVESKVEACSGIWAEIRYRKESWIIFGVSKQHTILANTFMKDTNAFEFTN
jgi:hypothetical protein